MQSGEEIAAYYEANPGPECPTCHSTERVISTIVGRPSSNLVAYAERPDSRVRLGGCVKKPGSNKFYCRSCNLGF
jgi:hypothetical protein